MAITIIGPQATGSPNQWNNSGGTDKMDSVQLPDDDGTTKITETSVDQEQEFDCYPDNGYNGGGATVGLPGTVHTVLTYDCVARANTAVAGTAGIAVKLGTTTNGYGAYTPKDTLTTGYVDYNHVDVPDGVGVMTGTDVGSLFSELSIIVQKRQGGGNNVRVTTLVVYVTWVPKAAGGFAYNVANWLTPLVGLGSLTATEIVNCLRSQYRWVFNPETGLCNPVGPPLPTSRADIEDIKNGLRKIETKRVFLSPALAL